MTFRPVYRAVALCLAGLSSREDTHAAGQSPPTQTPAGSDTADQPAPRTDTNSQLAHAQLVEKAKKDGIGVYFVGDSITRRWGTSDPQYADRLANGKTNFSGWNAADFGWGADRIQNILWRLENGELDGAHPKVIVVLAGANNLGPYPDDAQIADVTRGIRAIRDVCRAKAPGATIVLTAIFPRNDKMADKDGRLFPGMINDADKLHPTVPGYQVRADGLKPILTELLGRPPRPTMRRRRPATPAPPSTGEQENLT